jgi:hypothetical protein
MVKSVAVSGSICTGISGHLGRMSECEQGKDSGLIRLKTENQSTRNAQPMLRINQKHKAQLQNVSTGRIWEI